jgi:hypothetical protein
VTAAATAPSLRFGTRAAAVRRKVGPTAWVVLEELVVGADRHLRVVTNVRCLATELGLAKDTVAAALRRLKAVGILRRDRQQHAASGTFVAGSYVLTAAALSDVLSAADEPRRRTASRRPHRKDADQVTLFAAEPAE